jgi:hypothetical protein
MISAGTKDEKEELTSAQGLRALGEPACMDSQLTMLSMPVLTL